MRNGGKRMGLGWGLVAVILGAWAMGGCAQGSTPDPGSSNDDDGAPVEADSSTDGSGGGGAVGTTSGGGTTTGGSCDDTGVCGTCQTCADASACVSQYNTCLNSFDCLDYNACIDTCVDQLCYDDCGYYYPVGESQFLDYAVCVVCGACYNDCDGASACI
ncbi:MAG: hypothetical protein R3B72_33635 [Polyangiaceae bacterium]